MFEKWMRVSDSPVVWKLLPGDWYDASVTVRKCDSESRISWLFNRFTDKVGDLRESVEWLQEAAMYV